VIRRRPFFLLGLAAAAALAGACSRPAPDVAPPRRAARIAVHELRAPAPSQARLVEELVALAEAATAGEANTPFWEGSVGRTEAAWARAVHTAHVALRQARTERADDLREASELVTAATDEVVRARAEIRETGMGRREAMAMEEANVELATGQRLLAAQRYPQAIDELRAAKANVQIVHVGWNALHARFSDPKLRREWQEWASQTIADSRASGDAAILVDKLRRRVVLYRAGRAEASFAAELGANGLRRKEHAGDRATPEGRYRIVQARQSPATRYTRALLLDYPNDEDRMRFALAKRRGMISARAGIGSLIEIHGDGGEGRDWTDGCIALKDADIAWLYTRVHVGTPVTIVGTYEH
jgi:hypothetical protein